MSRKVAHKRKGKIGDYIIKVKTGVGRERDNNKGSIAPQHGGYKQIVAYKVIRKKNVISLRAILLKVQSE